MTTHARTIPYARPVNLSDALALLAKGYVPIAGGTDYYPARVAQPITDALLDMSAIPGMRGIAMWENEHEIKNDNKRLDQQGRPIVLGALTTWTDCLNLPLPQAFTALVQAAKQIGGWQVQNRATLGGNLCNASPAADGTVALLALNARVTLTSLHSDQRNGSLIDRSLPIDQFVLGNRQTTRRPDELLTAITIPRYSRRAKSVFLKLGGRQYLVISIVMVAVLIDTDIDGRISHCAIAVGACNRAAVRLTALEKVLIGLQNGTPNRELNTEKNSAISDLVQQYLPTALQALQPIDDVRGTAKYRLHSASELIQQAIKQCL